MKVLNESEMEQLNAKTLQVLAEVGFKVTHDETLIKFKKAGALVNQATSTIRIPPEMVKELLAKAAVHIVQTGLNGKILNVGGNNRYHISLSLSLLIIMTGCDLRF